MKQTKHLILALAVALAVGIAAPATAFAAHLTGAEGWSATYINSGTNGKMVENYPDAGSGGSLNGIADSIGHLQPGDDITFTISAIHENDKEADWYVSNDVVTTLEDSKAAAEGSNYEYLLMWEGPSETRTLYDSEHVGGTDSSGLSEATNALDDFIFLERMKKGQRGKLTLKVSLNGETEGNAYFDTLAQLKVRFAAQPVTESSTTNNNNGVQGDSKVRDMVKTGDEVRLFPFYVAMFVSGVLILILAITGVRERRRERKEGMR